MARFFSRLLHRDNDRHAAHAAPHHIDRQYVSEFTRFMDQFVEQHPEVLKEQHDGFRIYWDKRVDLKALEQAEKDSVPEDGYGFYFTAWTRGQH